jgi:hypothetical protein
MCLKLKWGLRFLSLTKESISQVFAIEYKVRDITLKKCVKQHLFRVHIAVCLTELFFACPAHRSSLPADQGLVSLTA